MAATGTLQFILQVRNANPKVLMAALLNDVAAIQNALLAAGFQGVTVSAPTLQDLTEYPASPTMAPTTLASNGGVISGIVIACAVAITGIVLLIIFVPKRRTIELPPDRGAYERAPHNYVIET